ncbi:MAG: type I-E CRISPR-associated protein Cas6/Cse3/CasE [Promethearchaeota archaeon]
MTGKKKKHNIVFYSVLFEGRLKITKLNEFKKILISGIGPGKAFGFGMLSIYPFR